MSFTLFCSSGCCLGYVSSLLISVSLAAIPAPDPQVGIFWHTGLYGLMRKIGGSILPRIPDRLEEDY
jgi:hypothetical protein